MKSKQFIGGLSIMSEYAKYLRWQYRLNLLRARGEEVNKGVIGKLKRQIRRYEAQHS